MSRQVMWSEEEIAILRRAMRDERPDRQVADQLGRSLSSVASKAKWMRDAGLAPQRRAGGKVTFWTEERKDMAAEMWLQKVSSSIIARKLGCTRNAVISQMRTMKIYRDVDKAPVIIEPIAKRKSPIEDKVVAMHRDNMMVSDMCGSLHVEAKVVRDILRKRGLEPHRQEHRAVHPCWSMSEDDRRMYFYHKFMAGWSKVLERLAEKA